MTSMAAAPAASLFAAMQRDARVHAASVALAASVADGALTATALRPHAEAIVAAAAQHESFGAFAGWALDARHEPPGIRLDSLPLTTLADIYRRAYSPSCSPPQGPFNALRVVSFDALSRARTTLDDFSLFYFSLHGLARDAFFRFLPILTFSEACIYQMDEENEAYTRRLVDTPAAEPSTPSLAWSDTPTGRALRGVLASRGLLSRAVVDELADGEQYWRAERRLCAAMAACEPVELDDVYVCSKLKSFDYRVLHALLCQLTGDGADAPLLTFLRTDECLTDTADDLFDYEKDVVRNSFNVLRGAVHAIGEAAPLTLATRIGKLEAEHEEQLQALSSEQRAAYCSSRRAAMARPGAHLGAAAEPGLRRLGGGSPP